MCRTKASLRLVSGEKSQAQYWQLARRIRTTRCPGDDEGSGLKDHVDPRAAYALTKSSGEGKGPGNSYMGNGQYSC